MKKVIFLSLLLLLIFLGYLLVTMPSIGELKYRNPHSTAFMRASGNRIQQVWVPLHTISPHLRKAVIASEDLYFYGHQGVDWDEVRASFEKNLEEFRFARGASTISMQVVKNLYLSKEKTLLRKFKEVLYTYILEFYLSKSRILEIYLNIVEWGPGIYGAEAASRYYFFRSAGELTAEQSAYLAAILPNPRALNKTLHQDWLERRMQRILRFMGRMN